MDWQQQFSSPFAYPYPGLQQPQPQPQAAQPDGQGGQSALYQPPAGAHPWPTDANLQAYNQNTQQSQYPPVAWQPPPVPTNPDAWNQLQQQLPLLMQSGLIPRPPLPGLHFPTAPQTPVQNAAPQNPLPIPSARPAQQGLSMQQSATVPNLHHTGMIGSDKEYREVGEGDLVPQLSASDGTTPVEPPRPAPQRNIHTGNSVPQVHDEPYNPDRPAAGQILQASVQHEKKQIPAANTSDGIPLQREEAKKFVKLLHQHNIGYRALAAEGLDAAPLRHLYRSLNLPSEPEPVPPPRIPGAIPPASMNGDAAAAHSTLPNASGSKPTTSVKTAVSIPMAKSAPSPVDRKDYIARLQAAKMSKLNAGAKVTPPQNTPPATSTVQPQLPAAANLERPLTEEEKKARTTELIRQRLEALKKTTSSPKAAHASRPPAGNGSDVASLSSITANAQVPPSSNNTQKPQLAQMPSFSGIPGLFMNSPTNAQPIQISPTLDSPTEDFVSRKRPLASDLVDPTSSVNPGAVQARSLGAFIDGSSAEFMDVEASEGESGGSEMDLSDENTSKPTVTSSISHPTAAASHRHLPTNHDFPSRPVSVNPPLSSVSTPGSQTPSSHARTGQLQRTEKELADLKLRLKERLKEQRRQKALAAAASSPAPTKASNDSSAQLASQSVHGSPGRVLSSRPEGTQDMSRELKRRRRAEIESGLPSLEAEIASNATRMAQLMKEMEQLTSNNERIKRDKERLISELESLGIDTEGMPHAELQAKKDEIDSERQAVSLNRVASPILSVLSSDRDETEAPVLVNPESMRDESQAQGQQQPYAARMASPVKHVGIPGLAASTLQSPSTLPTPPFTTSLDVPKPKADTASVPVGKKPPAEGGQSQVSSDQISGDPRTAVLQESATPIDDDEDFYSPEPTDVASSKQQPEDDQVAQTSAKSPSEEGEVAMSVSEEEEEYEPEEPLTFHATETSGAAHRAVNSENLISSSGASSSASSDTDEEEVYEPPDVDQPMSDAQATETVTGRDPIPRQVEAEDGAMEISSSDDESDDSSSSQSSTEHAVSEMPRTNDVEQPTAVADDLALELQPEPATVVSSAPHELAAQPHIEADPTRFVPYESPLKHFKSYRYHPNFSQEVPGGFLSMTFSHQIDPDLPLCPREAVGFSCVDPECKGQHFRSMNITGDKLLVQLGTANPGKSPDEKQRWNDGLRSVLKELRSKNTKDPNGIAIEIAKFRREFLKDDTRVVNL